MNGQAVTEKDDFIQRMKDSGGQPVVLTIEREGELMDVEITPQRDATGDYKIGVWVRDNAQGVGTMTYIDGQGNF